MYPVKSCGLKGEIEFAEVLRSDVTGHSVTLGTAPRSFGFQDFNVLLLWTDTLPREVSSYLHSVPGTTEALLCVFLSWHREIIADFSKGTAQIALNLVKISMFTLQYLWDKQCNYTIAFFFFSLRNKEPLQSKEAGKRPVSSFFCGTRGRNQRLQTVSPT